MSLELSILKLFCDSRDEYNKHHAYISSIDNLEREIKLLFGLVKMYYEAYDSNSISYEELVKYHDLIYPSSRDAGLHHDLIHTTFDITIQLELVKDILDQLIERHHATAIVSKLLPVMEGNKYGILDSVRADVDNYISLLHHPPDKMVVPEPCSLSVDELIEQEIMDEGIPWHLKPLTDAIGGAKNKTLGLIYAYVESGKTSFSLAAMAAQAALFAGSDQKIVYAGNEESAARLQLRFVQTIVNKTKTQVTNDAKNIQREVIEKGIDNTFIFDDITAESQLIYLLDEYQPTILYIDDITNMEVVFKRKTEGVGYLEALFRWYRKLATRYDCAIIGVSQGVGDAEDKKWLKLSDIFGSRVPIQRALDYGIGIGRKVSDPTKENLRFIHVPKNKLHDGQGGKFTVHFQRETCKWEVK